MGDYPIEATFRVGVLANHGVNQGIMRWQPMMDYLSDRLPGNRFEVVPLTFKQMDQQLIEHRIQFIVTNPGQYLNLSNQLPLSWLATMRSRKHNGATYAIGSAIIVRADSAIQTIADLHNSTIVATDPEALGGYQATIGLLNKKGFEGNRFFGTVHFLGFPLEPLVYQVRDGSVDAAITPFCTLEEMVDEGLIGRDDFRVINGQRLKGYDCDTSTTLYPNWSFAASDLVPSPITQKLTQALFELSADSNAAITARLMGWTSPVSQLTVIRLYDELQLQNNPPPLYQVAVDWFKRQRQWAWALLLIIVGAPFYHLWLEYRFRQKNEHLLAAEREIKEKELQLERMQSAAIVGEIGAGLAHELNQPIAAITQYSEGALMLLQQQAQPNALPNELAQVLAKIHTQSLRAGGVVHRIRGLLKQRRSGFQFLLLGELLEDALVLLHKSLEQHQIELKVTIEGEATRFYGDSVGLSQVLVNLLKNAIDAMEDNQDERQLLVQLHYQTAAPVEQQQSPHSWLLLQITDSGSGLSKPVEALMQSFASTKENGLGLGLAICRDVVLEHHGVLQLKNRSTQRGCEVSLWLPYFPEQGQQ
ncbi:sensor histidine kinase [Shewanella avicenniae]